MPRHPPCALHSLSQQRHNNTPSTKHFDKHTKKHTTPTPNQGQKRPPTSPLKTRKNWPALHTHTFHNHPPDNPPPTKHTGNRLECAAMKDARVHYADLKQQPHQPPQARNRALGRRRKPEKPTHPPPKPGASTADPSGPNSVLNHAPTNAGPMTNPPHPNKKPRHKKLTVDVPLVRHHHAPANIRHRSGCVLLRKEVIQPHLPVRLPCYDFVPIASPTFDGSLHKGWATGFGCCRLS